MNPAPAVRRALPVVWTLLLVTCVLSACRSTCRSADRRVHEDAGRLGPYAGSVLSGDLCFVSGKIGAERSGSFEREVETCIDAIETELARSGLDLGDVVEATVYLTDLDQYGAFNQVYGRRFPEPYPARACVQVAALPGDARVEIMVRASR